MNKFIKFLTILSTISCGYSTVIHSFGGNTDAALGFFCATLWSFTCLIDMVEKKY